MIKTAKAPVTPIRQTTQYTCMSTSMCMCLRAYGLDLTEAQVNKVMGAAPMQGATWEQALACAQHFGMQAMLVTPASVPDLKRWTDLGFPVMISWNPEGRPWSHASVVFDVDGNMVHVADPNIPDPEQTTRVVPAEEFYKKWYEDAGNYLVRRIALVIMREVTPDGQQAYPVREQFEALLASRTMIHTASNRPSSFDISYKVATRWLTSKGLR